MKKAPLQQAKERFGGKEKLVDAIVGLIGKPSGITKDELKKKLKAQSNRKLLVLYERENTVKERFGGRDKLIAQLCDVKKGKQGKLDKDYKKHLEKLSTGRLLDLARRYNLLKN
ncbi:MAG: hypothetical protein D6806_02625 [Deltaproteobacteria bacterium]|nr:MAG: hypothetical protein D6806_02625 [Deltaproteobacteria bacterium]